MLDFAQNPGGLEWISTAIEFIFSWVILLPIAVIVSGHLLSQRLKLDIGQAQILKIPIGSMFTIQATNHQVTLGFTGFILTWFCTATFAGAAVYKLFRNQFGVDPGPFYSVEIFSALATVVWAFIVYLITGIRPPKDPISKEHTQLIEKITEKK